MIAPRHRLPGDPKVLMEPAPREPRESRSSPVTIAAVLAIVFAVIAGVALLATNADNTADSVAGTAQPGQDDGANGAPGLPPGPRPVFELATNPLLVPGAGLPKGTCALPALDRTPESLRTFYQAEMDCLDNAWKTALDRVGEPFQRSSLEIELPEASACGDAPSQEVATAYYCGGDRTIYMPEQRLLVEAGTIEPAHLALLAHEYAHHIQELSGIMGAVEDRRKTVSPGSPEDLELQRRVELQANCFAGMFVQSVSGRGSIPKPIGDQVMGEYSRVQDSPTHGTREHQIQWARGGYSGKNTASCNTWSAAPADVA
jgi:predicted metalloprotease